MFVTLVLRKFPGWRIAISIGVTSLCAAVCSARCTAIVGTMAAAVPPGGEKPAEPGSDDRDVGRCNVANADEHGGGGEDAEEGDEVAHFCPFTRCPVRGPCEQRQPCCAGPGNLSRSFLS